MANLVPASNVQLAALAGALSVIIIQIMEANGIVIPESVGQDLPPLIVAAVAWAHDSFTGNNK